MKKTEKKDTKKTTKEIKPETKKTEAKPDTKKIEPAKTEQPKLTKKLIIMSLLDRKEGASLDECAEAITKSGIDPDTKKNRSTSLLYMSKLPKPVIRDEAGRYYWKT
jgi:hypothetical protein